MSNFDHAFSEGVLSPEEVRLLQQVFARISSELWFTRDAERRWAFASFILHVYCRGMVVPDKLEALCRAAARAHFVSDERIFVPQDGLGGNKILVVEDEALLARDVMKRLTATGATVIGPVASVGVTPSSSSRKLNSMAHCSISPLMASWSTQ